MTMECEISFDERPDARAELARLEKEKADLRGLLAACLRVGTDEALGELEERQKKVERAIAFGLIAVARADVANRLARVRRADDRIKPLLAEESAAVEAYAADRDRLVRSKANLDRIHGERMSAQASAQSERVALGDDEDRLQRLLNPASAQPANEPQGHSEMTGPSPQLGHGAWGRR